jgi:hypothetical protein
MNEITTIDNAEYHPIPGYHPLAISKDGQCVNVETKFIKRWNRAGNVFQLTHVPKDSDTFCITLCRALALCFVPVPLYYDKIPLKYLRAYYARKPENFEQAVDVAWIRWRLRNKITAVIRNTKTEEMIAYPDFAQASLSISRCSDLISQLYATHGTRFVYEHHEVNIHMR